MNLLAIFIAQCVAMMGVCLVYPACAPGQMTVRASARFRRRAKVVSLLALASSVLFVIQAWGMSAVLTWVFSAGIAGACAALSSAYLTQKQLSLEQAACAACVSAWVLCALVLSWILWWTSLVVQA